MRARPRPLTPLAGPVLLVVLLAGCGSATAPAGAPSTDGSATPTPGPATSTTERPRLDPGCHTGVTGISDYVEGATGTADPLGEARTWARHRSPGTEPVLAYEDAHERDYALLTDDGRVIAILHFRSDGQGGWLRDQEEACSDPPPSD
jgi:hypothetical protein